MTDTSACEGRGVGVTGKLEMDSLRQPHSPPRGSVSASTLREAAA